MDATTHIRMLISDRTAPYRFSDEEIEDLYAIYSDGQEYLYGVLMTAADFIDTEGAAISSDLGKTVEIGGDVKISRILTNPFTEKAKDLRARAERVEWASISESAHTTFAQAQIYINALIREMGGGIVHA